MTAAPASGTGRLERRKARTRAAILTAANHLFRQQGFAETSIAQVARHADTGVGTVYGYFASKEEILREVLRAQAEEAVSRYQQAISESTPYLDRVTVALRTHAAFVRENRTILRDGFVARGGLDHELTAWLFNTFQAMLEEGARRGELAPVPTLTTVRLLLTSYTMAVLGLATWSGFEDDAATLDDLEHLVRRILAPAP